MQPMIKSLVVLVFAVGAVCQNSTAPPIPDAVQPQDIGEISCHVQEVQQPNGQPSTWQPWLRAVRPDGSVWSKKAIAAKTQGLAQKQCEQWAEFASHLRTLHQMKADHDKRLSALESSHSAHKQIVSDTFAHNKGLIEQLQAQLQLAHKQIEDQGKDIETLRKRLADQATADHKELLALRKAAGVSDEKFNKALEALTSSPGIGSPQ